MTTTRTFVLLPVSPEVFREIAGEVTLRGQPDRVRGDGTIDLSDVALVVDEKRRMTRDTPD